VGRRASTVLLLLGFLAGALGSTGCFEFEKEPQPNTPPNTFFNVTPPDTTFRNEAFFQWIGTDLDSDVVAFQFQLVETDSVYFETGGQVGGVIRSIEPIVDTWSRRQTDNFRSFADLEDGWYEMRARSIDSEGLESDAAIFRYYVFFDDVVPVPIIGVVDFEGNNNQLCGRIGAVSSWTFQINASDPSRNQVTPRQVIEYSYELRGRQQSNCSTHTSDSPTDFVFFPPGSAPLTVGDTPPTLYADLFDPVCRWDFTLTARDPAGNRADVSCCITREGSCGAP